MNRLIDREILADLREKTEAIKKTFKRVARADKLRPRGRSGKVKKIPVEGR